MAETTGVVPSFFFLQFLDLYGLSDVEALHQVETYILWFHHSWTLAVEQQFYVLLPLIIVLFRPSARLVVVGACAAIACAVLLRTTGQGIGVLASRADGLLLGVILAVMVGSNLSFGQTPPERVRLLWPVLAAAGIVVVAPYLADGYLGRISQGSLPTNPLTVLGFSVLYFALVGWLVSRPDSVVARCLGSRALVHLGLISYAVYMLHPLIQGFVGLYDRTVPISELPLLVQAATWFLILGCSHLSKVLLEDRFNALKSRFPLYRDAGGPTTRALATS